MESTENRSAVNLTPLARRVKAALENRRAKVFNSFVEMFVEKARAIRKHPDKHCASCGLHHDEAFLTKTAQHMAAQPARKLDLVDRTVMPFVPDTTECRTHAGPGFNTTWAGAPD
jgi:hypothetical protein